MLALVAPLSACGTGQTLVKGDPNATEIGLVRQQASRIYDGTLAALTIVDDTGKLLNDLPIPTTAKDSFDCTIQKIVGNDAPTATVTKVCGAVPAKAKAPLRVALTELSAVTTCPSLRSTASRVLALIEPLIAKLQTGGNSTLSIAASALTATFSFTRTLLGGAGCVSTLTPS